MLNLTLSTTAVLLFNHSEKQKTSLRSIAPRITSKKLDHLINGLNRRVKRISKQADLPFFQIDADVESSFGEQLYLAYENLFLRGYDQVIGISNDCPELNSNDLKLTEKHFLNKDFVFGPAKDGGLYLLGIKKGKVSRETFINLDWQTSKLVESFNNKLAESSFTVAFLSVKSDMDTTGAFKRAFEAGFQFIKRIKNELLSFRFIIFKVTKERVEELATLALTLRGPPFYR